MSAVRTDLARDLVTALAPAAEGARTADVRIGLGYTAVRLEDDRLGVAYTFRDQARGGCAVFDKLRPLAPRPAGELLQLLESHDVIEAAVGLACANALAGRARPDEPERDVLDELALGPGDHVGMVGNFGPLVGPIRAQVKQLSVFERIEHPAGLMLPQREAPAMLPRCQVALITATAILHHELDALLEAAAGCREVVLLGPSTPMLPELFAARGVSLLSGVQVHDPAGVLRVVSEGGGMRQFRPHVRKFTLRLRAPGPAGEE
jgi:hypothetical protein